MAEDKDVAVKLAEEHWAYLEKILTAHGESPETVRKVGVHYQTAFIHGFKHGEEHAYGLERTYG